MRKFRGSKGGSREAPATLTAEWPSSSTPSPSLWGSALELHGKAPYHAVTRRSEQVASVTLPRLPRRAQQRRAKAAEKRTTFIFLAHLLTNFIFTSNTLSCSFSEPPIWGHWKGGHSDLVVTLICSVFPVFFRSVLICNSFLFTGVHRFGLISCDLFRLRELQNIYHHHPESKKRESSEGNSGSIHSCGRYGNAGKTSQTMPTIAILWPVKAIFEKRAATVEVDTFICPAICFPSTSGQPLSASSFRKLHARQEQVVSA